MADVDDLVYELREADGEPAGAIVLLHGRGTSEQDLIPLLDVLDPRERLVGAFPRGPLQLPRSARTGTWWRRSATPTRRA